MVNNAGVMLLGPALGTTTDEWDRMIALNVQGLLYVTHAALPRLVEAAGSSPRRVANVVNVSSTAGRVARPGSSVYNLTKFGVNAFSEALRQELVGHRVRVSVVKPGTVATELVDHVTGDVQAAARKQVAAIEALLPEDIADAVAYIVTRTAGWRSTRCSSGQATRPGNATRPGQIPVTSFAGAARAVTGRPGRGGRWPWRADASAGRSGPAR